MKPSSIAFMSAIAAMTLGAPSALAGDGKPAVAAPNGSVDISGGSVGLESKGAIGGKLSLPLAENYGFQVDAAAVKGEDTDSEGAAFHFFRRDPSSYLVGITGMAALSNREKTHQIYRTGLETEFYMGNFTLASSGGYQRNFGQNWAYLDMGALYYVNDNLTFGLNGGGYSNYRYGAFETEWQPMEKTPLSVFANVGAGNRGGGFGLVGVRFNFGTEGTSLKTRHREYDPPNIVSAITGAGGGGGVSNTVGKVETPAPARAPAPAPAPVPPAYHPN